MFILRGHRAPMPLWEETSACGFCPHTCSGALEILREEPNRTVVRGALGKPCLPACLSVLLGRVSQSGESDIWLNSHGSSFQSDDLYPSALSVSALSVPVADCPSAQGLSQPLHYGLWR